MDADKNVTALFEKRDYPLIIHIEGEGTVDERVVQAKTTDYPHGTVVELTANPKEGWKFSGWEEDLVGEENPVEITIEEERMVTANFERIEYSLNIEIEGKGEVKQTIVSSKVVDYPHGSVLELEAVPESGSVFTGWQGDITGIENPIELEMLGEYTIKAIFEEVADIEVEGKGSVHIELYNDEDQHYQQKQGSTGSSFRTGRRFRLAPYPAPKFKFSHWEGAYEGNEETIIVEEEEDLINIRAVFLTEEAQWELQFHEDDIDYNSGLDSRETEIFLMDVNFANSRLGYAVGGGASTHSRSLILKTSDGGETWREWAELVGTREKFTSVYSRQIRNSNFTWAGGWNGSVVRITSGTGFEEFHGYETRSYDGQPNVSGMHFFPDVDPTRSVSEGIITRFGGRRYGMLRKSCCIGWSPYNQYGSFWNEVNFPYALQDIHFHKGWGNQGEKNGWVVGFTTDRRTATDWDYIGIVGRTTDRGYTWELIRSNIHARFLAVYSLGKNTAWVTGSAGGSSRRGGVIYRTTDGGGNWELQLETEAQITDIHFTDHFNGWAVSRRTIYRTRDGGENWYVEASLSSTLNAIYFTDRNHGWAVGYRGSIYRYFPVE
ncbi:MAG: hypothetical protein JJU13_13665 [Balneolaceae bacterium]|nr:hypothetical protein [Balneolaceae bacterium]